MIPGETQLTQIGASSSARLRANDSISFAPHVPNDGNKMKRPRASARKAPTKSIVARRGGRLTELRRQEIVALVASLFLDRGYEQVTIDDIVAPIGGSKRTLYDRFGGKAGLFEMVIKQYCAIVHRDMFAGVDQSKDTEEHLISIGTHFLSMILHRSILDQHRLMVAMGKNFPNVAQMFFQAGPQRAYNLIASWIEKQQMDGKIGPGNAAIMAELSLDMPTGRHF